MALADWILPQLTLPGGPVLTPYRSPSGTNQPGPKAVTPPLAGPFDFANAMTSMANVGGENQLRQVQANLYGVQGQQATATLQMLQRYPDMLQSMFKGGAPGVGQSTAPSASPATFGSLAPQPDTSSGGGNWETAHNNFAGMRIPGSTVGPNAGGFQAFATPEDGIAAISRQLDRYASGATTGEPVTTLRGIVSTWAPPNENDTNGLIARAAKVTGFEPDATLDVGNPEVKAKLVEALIRGEQGGKLPLDKGLISSALGNPGQSALTVGGGMATAPAPSAISPNFGSLAPTSGPINPGLPGLENFDPVKAAIAGSIMEAYKLPNAAAPMLGLYQNSPGYKAAVEAASKWAAVPPELFTKWNSPMTARPGGGILNAANGAVVGAMPTLQKTSDPTGQESFTYMTPGVGEAAPSLVPTGAVAALGPEQAASLKARGTATGGLPFVQPTAEAQASGAEAGKARIAYGDLLNAPLPGASPLTPQAINTTNPIPTDHGTLLPSVAQQGSRYAPAELDKKIPEWAKRTSSWVDTASVATEAEQRLTTIAQAFKLAQPGSFATNRAEIATALKALGLPEGLAGSDNPAMVQTALHENYMATLTRLKAATSRFTQQEFKTISAMSEHPNLQPEANQQMLAEDIALSRRYQQLPQDWYLARRQGWQDPEAFQQAWLAANPLDKAVEQVKNEIGPLKGMAKPLDDATRAAASDAIAKGAPRDAVLKRLKDSGYDASKF